MLAKKVDNFLTRRSWKLVDCSTAEASGKSIILSKWVHKKKQEADGSVRYKSRFVSKGCMQLPDNDYTKELFSVASEIPARLICALILYFLHWVCKNTHIETAFLEKV